MTKINKQFGFYGTIKDESFEQKDVDTIWDLINKKLVEIYPEKTEDDIVEFLNSRIGRHFADYLVDSPKGPSAHVTMWRISTLNRLKVDKYWEWFHDGELKPKTLCKSLLYKNALKNQIKKKKPRELMIKVLGCGTDQVWKTPEMWLDSFLTTASELETMWLYVQEILKKD